jgi:hypothetical protein
MNSITVEPSQETGHYVPPFQMFQKALGIGAQDLMPEKKVVITSELFKLLLGMIVSRGFFDERWYLETYPDVHSAIERGRTSSALEHYLNAGYYEGRSPGPCFVDRAWYEQYYQDVGGGLENGTIIDSAEHFHQNGYFEGRVPTADQLADAEKWHDLLYKT